MQVTKFGHKWTKKPSGYYQSTTNIDGKRRWLHQYTWSFEYGKQKKGWHVHHKDENKDNNDISNLEHISASEHSLHHGEFTEERKEAARINLAENARPKAAEWHRSEEGRRWHSEQAKKNKNWEKKYKKECKYCKKEFEGHINRKYCSRKCEWKYMAEDVKNYKFNNVCKICKTEFMWFQEKNTCSWECQKQYTANRQKEQQYEHKCVHCGSIFTNQFKTAGRFCSTTCRTKAKYTKKVYNERKCDECGKKFQPKTSRNRFCSLQCGKHFHHKLEKSRKKKSI